MRSSCSWHLFSWRLVFVLSIVLTLAGLIALTQIPVAQFPEIVPPQVSVTTRYPGANAEVLESTVAQPIEQQVTGVDSMQYMQSVSGADGSAHFCVGPSHRVVAVRRTG